MKNFEKQTATKYNFTVLPAGCGYTYCCVVVAVFSVLSNE
jgi:hypothetical protein